MVQLLAYEGSFILLPLRTHFIFMYYLFLAGIFIAFFLTLLLLPKANKTAADYLLMTWFFFSGYNLLAYYFVFTHQVSQFPNCVILGINIPLLQGPFLFLYIKYQTNLIRFNKKDLCHFIPFLVFTILYGQFFLLSHDEKIALLKAGAPDFERIALFKLISIYVSGIVYIPLSYIKLQRFRKNLEHAFSNTERIQFNWLLYQIIGLAIVWIVVLFIQDDEFVFSSAAIFLIWMGYFGIKQVNVFNSPELSTVQGSNTEIQVEEIIMNPEPWAENDKEEKKDATLDAIHEQLQLVLIEKKPYLNPELKLIDLAKLLNVHSNTLSKVINLYTEKTFYDLVNEKRVEEFLLKLKDPQNAQYTLIALAYDAGFNSKASFQRNFKKIIGMTPSEYLNSQKEVSSGMSL
jgi:AraC-like DNA-binding protein